MPEAIIKYCNQKAKVACDGMCNKAWGIQNRPKEQLSEDIDDVIWYADQDLPEAPRDPGTYEGGEGKPKSSKEFPNKWCVRECERSVISDPGNWIAPLKLKDWSKRIYNIPRKDPIVEVKSNLKYDTA